MAGPDPSYARIDGEWLDDEAPYGVIHRLASDGTARGVFDACLAFCGKRWANLRIDTHRDNRAMRHLVESRGFSFCGTIEVREGEPRLAYQRMRG